MDAPFNARDDRHLLRQQQRVGDIDSASSIDISKYVL